MKFKTLLIIDFKGFYFHHIQAGFIGFHVLFPFRKRVLNELVVAMKIPASSSEIGLNRPKVCSIPRQKTSESNAFHGQWSLEDTRWWIVDGEW